MTDFRGDHVHDRHTLHRCLLPRAWLSLCPIYWRSLSSSDGQFNYRQGFQRGHGRFSSFLLLAKVTSWWSHLTSQGGWSSGFTIRDRQPRPSGSILTPTGVFPTLLSPRANNMSGGAASILVGNRPGDRTKYGLARSWRRRRHQYKHRVAARRRRRSATGGGSR